MTADLMCYLEYDVAIGLIELSMESFIHLERNKVLYLPHCYTWNLQGRGNRETDISVCCYLNNANQRYAIRHTEYYTFTNTRGKIVEHSSTEELEFSVLYRGTCFACNF